MLGGGDRTLMLFGTLFLTFPVREKERPPKKERKIMDRQKKNTEVVKENII